MENSILILPITLSVIMMVVVCGFVFYLLYKKYKKDKEFNEEMMKRLPEVEYTEIVSSSNGENGTISMHNSETGTSFGSYGSLPTTKFLVVYKSGDKQIVNLRDGTPLFDEYVRLLKK